MSDLASKMFYHRQSSIICLIYLQTIQENQMDSDGIKDFSLFVNVQLYLNETKTLILKNHNLLKSQIYHFNFDFFSNHFTT